MTNILAFDPGISGAWAVYDNAHWGGILVDSDDLPTIGDGTQCRINAADLADTIRAHMPYAFAIVEQVHAMPKNGVASMFRFGQSYGTLLGILGALAIPVKHVTPATWKKAMKLDNSAETSRARAIETWPDMADRFSRKMDHNRAEACLLALYGAGLS